VGSLPWLRHKKRDIPGDLWVRCTGCKATLFGRDLDDQFKVCPKCDHHFPISSHLRIAYTLDPATWQEHDAGMGAVDALGFVDIDRIGHGGHSYGAFATANILANSPFFKAGIAGDGAYNRSLTPGGFQAERRLIWEAPQTYIEMSPFFRADQLDTPLLMYHGGDDNNSGTFPVQSRRMIQALTTLGKTAVLHEYPFESHTPRAIENKFDMWARFIGWFDEYVKGAEERTISEEGG